MTVKLPPIPVLLIVLASLLVAFAPLPNVGWLPWEKVEPSPVTTPALVCLIVEADPVNRSKLLTPGQREAALSTAAGGLRDYVKSKGGEFRFLDDNNDVSKDSPWVQEAFKVMKEPYPWMLIAKDGKASVGPLPLEAAETLAVAKKVGGP